MQSSKHWLLGKLKGFIGYFNNIKKAQAKMKVTLSEIKKNLQGISSGVDEAKNQ